MEPEKKTSTPANLGRDRLFAVNILQHGTLNALREAGAGLLRLDTAERRERLADLQEEAGRLTTLRTPDMDDLVKLRTLEALAEIEADIAIKRVSASSRRPMSARVDVARFDIGDGLTLVEVRGRWRTYHASPAALLLSGMLGGLTPPGMPGSTGAVLSFRDSRGRVCRVRQGRYGAYVIKLHATS
jgi:hypothetical protein